MAIYPGLSANRAGGFFPDPGAMAHGTEGLADVRLVVLLRLLESRVCPAAAHFHRVQFHHRRMAHALAGETGYSPAHFQRVFTRHTGLSPAAYARAFATNATGPALLGSAGVAAHATLRRHRNGHLSRSRSGSGSRPARSWTTRRRHPTPTRWLCRTAAGTRRACSPPQARSSSRSRTATTRRPRLTRCSASTAAATRPRISVASVAS